MTTTITQKPNLSVGTLIKTALAIYDQPDSSYVLGIDTSHWTGVVDWPTAKENGIHFAIIKALDGESPVRYLEENYKGAKDAGILVGLYQWLYKATQISPGGQARTYLALLKDHPCDIVPSVDFEWSPNGKKFKVDTGDLWGFIQPFEQGFGKKPMIYTAPGYWDQYGSPALMWADYPLWQAQYAKQPQKMTPWTLWKIWQFTATGEGAKYGVPASGEHAVDLDYWCGTLADLYKWCGRSDTTNPPPVVTPPVTVDRTAILDEAIKAIEAIK